MPTKVLVFESDPAFAGELRTELGRLGLAAQIVDDGNAGLLAAASERPDLILLSIELPRMSGFSVCNKLKRDPVLKDVPLIIMSSESSDDTFEQHRKLRWRAEDYVHKPIAFGELLEHIRPYVPLDGNAGAGDDAGIVIEDEINIDDADDLDVTLQGQRRRNSVSIAAEVDAFADSAFDRLLDSGPLGGLAPKTPPPLPGGPLARRSSGPPARRVSSLPATPAGPRSDIGALLASAQDPTIVNVDLGAQSTLLGLGGGPRAAPSEVDTGLSLLESISDDAVQSLPPSELLEDETVVKSMAPSPGPLLSAGIADALEPEAGHEPAKVEVDVRPLELEVLQTEAASAFASPPNVRKSSVPPRPTVDAEVTRLRGEVERQRVESTRLERELGDARLEIQRLEGLALQEPDGSTEEIARLTREVEELRLKAPAGAKVGGVSSREFLDLREALNKKDKEILSLRDIITRKEKELLDASDSALSLERDKADLDDKIASVEKEMQGAKQAAETAKADKEQAAKRAEDFKTRGEKTKAELDTKVADLAAIQQRHEGELAARDAAAAALRDQHQQELAGVSSTHDQAREAAKKAADERREVEVREAREAEQRARYDAVSKLKEEAEAERRAHEGALAQLKSELEADKAAALGNFESELRQQGDERLAFASRTAEEEKNRLNEEIAKGLEATRAAEEQLVRRESELLGQQHVALEALKGELEGRLAHEKGELETRFLREKGEFEARLLHEKGEVEVRLAHEKGELEARLAAEKAEIEGHYAMQRSNLDSERAQERQLLESRVNELATDLATRTEERETFSRDVVVLRDKVAVLEASLGEAKSELASTRERLSAQSQRLDVVTSKWQLNRTSLEQAKDAIAAAVAQIEEAETRGLE